MRSQETEYRTIGDSYKPAHGRVRGNHRFRSRLAEVSNLESDKQEQLARPTRGQVLTGDDAMIGGFISTPDEGAIRERAVFALVPAL